MREIKFRAWDTRNKVMIVSECANLVIHFDGLLNFITENGEVEGTVYTDQIPLMQFTGLLDHNGKEIYEGDIVKYNNVNYSVVWNTECACWYVSALYECSLSFTRISHLFCEVIGNIYEHSELLHRAEAEDVV